MDNKNGGQGGAVPSWNAWAAAAKNKTVNSGANSQPAVLTSEQLSARQQQKTVTDLARKKLLEAYKATAQGQGGDGAKPTAKVAPRRATTQDWQKYHSAWQNYYQKYYGEYYGKAAREYVAREKMRMERSQLERERKDKQANANLPKKAESLVSTEEVQNDFRAKIRRKAEERASRIRRSRHFIPLILGGLILLFGICFQYNQVIASHVVAYMSPGNTEVNEITAIDPTLSIKTHDKPYLMIPKLNIEVPVIFGAKNDVNSMNIAMDNGVANFAVPGAAAKPGEVGNFVISGHSAGNIYQQSNYKFIFSGLTRMKEGDLIYMDYSNVRYAYKVTGMKTVKPTDVAALKKIANDNEGKPMITLITCVPLGTSRERLLVYGEQISPSYEGAVTPAPDEGGEDDGKAQMPANHDSPLEGLWKWLTGQS
ncbi:sortase [Candidatus Saccharibacteria bacterium]|nr:sortase [Candidatus Saccharibacteria bacterium]